MPCDYKNQTAEIAARLGKQYFIISQAKHDHMPDFYSAQHGQL